MLSVIYAECLLCCAPYKLLMLSVAMLNVVMPSAVMLNVVAPLRIPICKNQIEQIILLNIVALCSLPRHFSWYRARDGFEPLTSGPVVERSTACLRDLG